MNIDWFKIALVAFVALFLQLFFFDSLYLYGYISPMVYILPIFIVPFQVNKSLFYTLSFLLGLLVDIFHGTGGIHASAALLITALRYPLFTVLSGKDITTSGINAIYDVRIYILALYLFILTFIHHFTVFYLDYFRLNAFVAVLKYTFVTLFFSFFILFLSIALLKRNNNKG